MKYILFLLFLFATKQGTSAPGREISYLISPWQPGNLSALTIKMSLKGNSSGKTLLTIPYETGQYRPQDQLQILQVLNAKKHSLSSADSSEYIIEHAPNVQLTVIYNLRSAIHDSLPSTGEEYAQMITGKYFYLIGSSSWIIPVDRSKTPYDIRMNWTGFPANWKFLSSFSAHSNRYELRNTLDNFLQAIYMGGDLRIHELNINNSPLYFGIRGNWPFTDQQIIDIIQRTVSSQRAFWNDHDVDRYTISLIPMNYQSEKDRSMNGRGLTNTFVTVGTNTPALNIMDLAYLYNHELMHHWLGHLLKQPEPENAYKWFFEGFTDFFAHKIMLQEGLLDSALFKKSFNKIFSQYYGNSRNQYPNSTLEKEYWSSSQMQKLPYQRGLIFAFYLDESIIKETDGKSTLRDIVSRMVKESTLHQKQYSNEWLLQLLRETTGRDYSDQLQEFMIEGKFIGFSDWKNVTDKLIMDNTRVYDPGFDTDKGTIALNARITEICEGSEIQKAGLAKDDILVGYSTNYNPADTTTLTVLRNKEKIQFRYLAARETQVPKLK